MVVVPAVAPVITPVAEPMVAVPVVLLLHVPPVVASVSAIVEPEHTLKPADGPRMLVGTGFTVTVVVAVQPTVVVYVTTDVPVATLVMMPVLLPMVATPVVPLVHVPPAMVPASVVPLPAHMVMVPVSGPGTAFTVTVCVT